LQSLVMVGAFAIALLLLVVAPTLGVLSGALGGLFVQLTVGGWVADGAAQLGLNLDPAGSGRSGRRWASWVATSGSRRRFRPASSFERGPDYRAWRAHPPCCWCTSRPVGPTGHALAKG
jgi:hypothetical protein